MKRCASIAGTLSALGVTACLAGTSSPVPTLRIGDLVPQLNTDVTWIQGQPVRKFIQGRVYIVEFWATWCPICNGLMPHLSELQRKYAHRLTLIAVDVHESDPSVNASYVRNFVKKKGDKMAYTVAMDDPIKKTQFDAWMAASGLKGIPAAFVIDRHGRLVWGGYPSSTDTEFHTAIEQALSGTPGGR
jgi:thiol-disulfide isomerase/thioredoxin